jgi:hypothetical protein
MALIFALVVWPAYNLGVIRGRQGTAPLQEASVFRTPAGDVPQPSAAAGQGPGTPCLTAPIRASSRPRHPRRGNTIMPGAPAQNR